MIRKTLTRRRSSSCFRPAGETPATPTTTTTTNLTTSLYQTRLGIFALTWSHTLIGSAVDVHLLPHHHLRRRLSFSPLLFWKLRGSDSLPLPSGETALLLWDLTRARPGPGPEPLSGFHISVLLGSETLLHVGDLKPGSGSESGSSLVVRREHVHGATRRHVTRAKFGGKTRAISIECDGSDPDPRLVIRVDDRKALQVKHLRWKFRGGERIDVDGHPILISWDVYNWLFDDVDRAEGYALFTLRFESDAGDGELAGDVAGERVLLSEELPAERGWRKKKGLVGKTRSSSSSASSASSACGSVLEWESVEETELKGPTGFSLLVYTWKA